MHGTHTHIPSGLLQPVLISANWSVSFPVPLSLECFAGFVQGAEVAALWPLESGNCNWNLWNKPAGEDCVLGAGQFLVEEGVGSFPFMDAVGMPHARLKAYSTLALSSLRNFARISFRKTWLLMSVLAHPQTVVVEGRLLR